MKHLQTSKRFFAGVVLSGALALTLVACSAPVSADNASFDTNVIPAAQTQAQANTAAPALQQGAGGQGQNGQGAGRQNQGHQGDMTVNLPPAGDVDDQEIADLLWMREEEKVARDVYITLGEQWQLPVFSNISQAEQQHMDAIAVLLERYGITDPVTDDATGVFSNPELQALYDQLVAQGGSSVSEALKVGATIEEVDILDLEKALANTDNADIQQVYNSLKAGSENHLRAFVRTLQQQTGESYAPQYLDQAAYDAIMAGSQGRGHGQTGDCQGDGRQGQGGQGGHGQGQGSHGQGQGGQGKGGHGQGQQNRQTNN